ncbi:MAG: single-stranded-DNA-specific exonuclease RecJ [Spirochaetaceae bacterium]|nr:MAG: single-stranded-DNA-specific exonuclease RecJ [Spirochaetaceae bacterium]
MKWTKPPVDPDLVRELSRTHRLELLSAAILVRRGLIEPQDLLYFLEEDPQYLHNPFLFEEMEDAVDRILTARAEGERVLVFGDRDADGITSITILVQTLRELGIDVDWALPLGDDPYGLTVEAVERFAAADGTLILAVDCGITNVAEIRRAAELGVDVIVLDHHNPQQELPDSIAIINPKMPDTGYPFAGLCGCALAGKLRWALLLAQTDLYKQTICLLNVRPGNETVVFDAVKLENLLEVDRISETVVPGMVGIEDTRIGAFLQGHEVLAYDAAAQERMIRRVFGSRVDVALIDTAPEIWNVFPALERRSLLKILESSRLPRYRRRRPEEIDVFVTLFVLYMQKRVPALEDAYQDVSDLIALGTIADMMPMRDENRILVRMGLGRMRASPRPGLLALIERQGLLGKSITSQDVGYQLAPVINASGRMGEPDKAVRLFLSQDPAEIGPLVDQVVKLNVQRREIGDQAWGRVLPQARTSFETFGGKLVVVQDDEVHRGITGILAGRLSRQFRAPALVMTSVNGKTVGSVRSVRGFLATEFLKQFEDILDEWGGHDPAAGFALASDRVVLFLQRAAAAVDAIQLHEDEQAVLIDAEIPHVHMTPQLHKVVDAFAPYGQANAPLVFLVRHARLVRLDFMGREEQHLRMTLAVGSFKWPAVYWNAAARVNVDFGLDDTVDVVFQLEKNYFQNRENTQLSVIDISRATREGAPGAPQ